MAHHPIGKRLLARFPRVLAVSSDIKDDLVRHGADPYVVVLLNDRPSGPFSETLEVEIVRQQLGFSPNEYVIGAVAGSNGRSGSTC